MNGSAPESAGLDAASLAAIDRFVEAWGRMGSVWGISRTMAEVHALLYITAEPMCTDDVMSRLQISRGNASMSLRALLDWGIIGRVHRRGDRKEYYQADLDVWSIFRSIVRERLKREVDPLLAALHEIRDEERSAGRDRAAAASEAAKELDARLDSMIEFLELGSGLADRFIGPSGPGLRIAATIASKAAGLSGVFARGRRGGSNDRAAADDFEARLSLAMEEHGGLDERAQDLRSGGGS